MKFNWTPFKSDLSCRMKCLNFDTNIEYDKAHWAQYQASTFQLCIDFGQFSTQGKEFSQEKEKQSICTSGTYTIWA